MIIDGDAVYHPILDEIIKVICNLDNIQILDYLIVKLKSMKQAYQISGYSESDEDERELIAYSSQVLELIEEHLEEAIAQREFLS